MRSKHSAQYSIVIDQIQDIIKKELDLGSLPGREQNFAQLGGDSLDRIEVETQVEELFGIIIPGNDSGSWETIEELVDVIKELTE